MSLKHDYSPLETSSRTPGDDLGVEGCTSLLFLDRGGVDIGFFFVVFSFCADIGLIIVIKDPCMTFLFAFVRLYPYVIKGYEAVLYDP